MERKDSILYRATKDNEDCTTELLCNLMREKYIRDIILLNLGVSGDVINKISFDDITTQVYLRESGKPDICIKNKDLLIYIENKIRRNTDLRGSQTTTYLKELIKSEKHHKQMIYIIPKDYDHLNKIDIACEQNAFCSRTLWEDFLANVSKYEIGESNLVFRECFHFFEDKILSKSVLVKFNPQEIVIMYKTKDLIAANSFFIKLHQVIEKADGQILTELRKNSEDFSFCDWSFDSENEKGKFINYKGEDKIFYGLNFNIVNDKTKYSETLSNADFLMGVAVMNDIVDIEKLKMLKNKKDIISDNEWTYIKMDDYNLTEDNVSEAFAKNVTDIIKALFF